MQAPIAISLMVDDGAPVNPMFFQDPPYERHLLIPNALARDFADLCDEYGVRGKFSHMLAFGPVRGPSVAWRNPETGQTVVSIPAITADPFWDTQMPASTTQRAARAAAKAGVDVLLSADGRTGRLPEVIAQGCPATILTHWQSLYAEGTCAGLWGLERLFRRLRQRYGDDLEWVTCSELAEQAAKG